MSNFNTFEELSVGQIESVSDYFTNPLGQWINYATYNNEQLAQVLDQKHTDIRTFHQGKNRQGYLRDLDGRLMSNFERVVSTTGTVGSITGASSPWTATITGMSSTAGLTVGDVIFAVPGTGSLGSGGVYTVASIVSQSSITFTATGGTTPTAGTVTSISNPLPLTQVGPFITILTKENWSLTSTTATSAVVSTGAATNKWNELSVAITGSGTTIVSSTGSPINLSSYQSTDKISVALPSVPSELTLGSCKIKFTDGTNTDSITFTSAGVTTSGNKELSFNLSSLTSVNKSNITGVSFELVTTNNCTFKCMAIRCLSSSWRYAPLDINTVEKTVTKPAPLNGSFTGADSGSSLSTGDSITFTDSTKSWETNQWAGGYVVIHTGNKPVAKIISNTATTITVTNWIGTAPTGSGLSYNLSTFPIMPGTDPQRSYLPAYWPILVRSFGVGEGGQYFSLDTYDPKVIDGKMTIAFNTGSITSSTASNIKMHYRINIANIVQSDLNNKSQDYLNKLGNFDNLKSNFVPKRQSDLSKIPGYWVGNGHPEYQLNPNSLPNQDGLTQSQLETFNQGQLERQPSSNTLSHQSIGIYWYKSGADLKFEIKIESEIGVLYTFGPFAIVNNQDYAFVPFIENNTIYANLYRINEDRSLSLIYESPHVVNDDFIRIRGRIGWSASLVDADASIADIRSSGLVYAEYKTEKTPSITPLKGAQLISDYSPNFELLNGISKDPWSDSKTLVNLDTTKSNSGEARKISTAADGYFEQGVITNSGNPFVIEDPNDLIIKFDVWFPNNGSKLIVYLYRPEDKAFISVFVPPFSYNQWDTIELILDEKIPSGLYQLAILQNNIANDSIWWIDNIQIKKRLIEWSARSSVAGPWEFDGDDWIDFKNTVNVNNSGVMLFRKGHNLQLKAWAKSHYAEIYSIDLSPIYAELGNLVWKN